MMSELANIDYEPFWLSLKLSFITTFILFFFCVALAYFMSQKKFFGKAFLESVISLPLVLPPSVLGFYLLIFLSPYSAFGKFIEDLFGVRMVFNFTGLVVASVLINRQICEVVLSSAEASGLRAGDTVVVSTKAFGVNLVKA